MVPAGDFLLLSAETLDVRQEETSSAFQLASQEQRKTFSVLFLLLNEGIFAHIVAAKSQSQSFGSAIF